MAIFYNLVGLWGGGGGTGLESLTLLLAHQNELILQIAYSDFSPSQELHENVLRYFLSNFFCRVIDTLITACFRRAQQYENGR